MSNISHYSDSEVIPHYASSDEISVLHVAAEARSYPANVERKIASLEQEIAIESARKYPNMEYITHCSEKILEIRQTAAICERVR